MSRERQSVRNLGEARRGKLRNDKVAIRQQHQKSKTAAMAAGSANGTYPDYDLDGPIDYSDIEERSVELCCGARAEQWRLTALFDISDMQSTTRIRKFSV